MRNRDGNLCRGTLRLSARYGGFFMRVLRTRSVFVGAALVLALGGFTASANAQSTGRNEVEVVAVKRARRSNPEEVKIEVVTHADGVTICAVYPSRDGAQPNVCAPGKEGRMNTQNNDVNVEFTVRVPAGVRLI